MTEDELGVLGRVWDGMGWYDDIRSGFYVPQPMPKTFIHVFFMLQAKRMLQLPACLPLLLVLMARLHDRLQR